MFKFGGLEVAYMVIGVFLGVIVVLLGIWFVPQLMHRKKQYSKKKGVQKKVTDELVFNTRYQSPSTVTLAQTQAAAVSINIGSNSKQDYGSLGHRERDMEAGNSLLPKANSNVNKEKAQEMVPTISVTCDDEQAIEKPPARKRKESTVKQPLSSELVTNFKKPSMTSDAPELGDTEDMLCIQKPMKRRFSSIVFTHSDELKILSDGDDTGSVYEGMSGTESVGGGSGGLDVFEKRERRASMSLFDTCKLACPELSKQEMGHSTEFLNKIVLGGNDMKTVQGKLYFTLNHSDDQLNLEPDKHTISIGIIKVSDVLAGKKSKYFYVYMELFHGNSLIYERQTATKVCNGEVVNFDENFEIEIKQMNPEIDEDGNLVYQDKLIVVFGLWQGTSGSSNAITQTGKSSGKYSRICEVRFDLMGLIEGQLLSVDGEEQFVICRSFCNNSVVSSNGLEKEKIIETTGKIQIFLRILKRAPLDLVIGIVAAKDIDCSKPFNSLNVRISLATEKKVIDSRKTRIIKQKSSNLISQKSTNSTTELIKIDESFEFDVSLMKMLNFNKDSVKLNKYTSENMYLTVILCGRNNIGFSHVLGKCILGPIQFADGVGLLHWTRATNKLGDVHYQWHNLKS